VRACARARARVVMDPHHINHHTPTEVAPGGGTSSNGSQTSHESNSTTPVVIPGSSSCSSSSAPPPPVVVGATQAPLTSPVPFTKIVSRNVKGTCELLSHHAVFWIELSVRVTCNHSAACLRSDRCQMAPPPRLFSANWASVSCIWSDTKLVASSHSARASHDVISVGMFDNTERQMLF
jgi:hypothetical protein